MRAHLLKDIGLTVNIGMERDPFFLQLGGESASSSSLVTSLAMSQYSKTHHALQVGIEHRYYGESYPFRNSSSENLKWLTSEQALADAVNIVLYIKSSLKMPDVPVIAFGCSYSGSLAAWIRIKYPHIIMGSVSSSSPVEAVTDFFGYLDVVDKSIRHFTGEECNKNILAATSQVEYLLRKNRSKLETDFGLCNHIVTDLDVSTFMATLMSNFQGQVQYNLEGPSYNISSLCLNLNKIVRSGYSPYDAYTYVNKVQHPFSCIDCSYEGFIKSMSNLDYDESSDRLWFYQTCTEFGYFQTTDSSSLSQPFGDLVPLSYYIKACRDIFGHSYVPSEQVKETNRHYGGQNLPPYITSNIVFVNGDIDPWHVLSVYKERPGVCVILIEGTAHCASVSLVGEDAPPQIQAAQEKISNLIQSWLAKH